VKNKRHTLAVRRLENSDTASSPREVSWSARRP
jgi:hypothetical protein